MKRRELLAGSAAAVAYAYPRIARAQSTPIALNVALTANDSAAQVLYAKELGFFDQAGLSVTLQLVGNGNVIAAGLVAGSIDFGNSNVLSVVTGFARGVPLTIVAPASIYDGKVPQLSVLVPKTSNIQAAKDLAGKVIAANPLRSIADSATKAWIEKAGTDSSTVRWIEMPYAEMGAALAQGRIDAAAVTEPFTTLDRETTRTLGWPYSAIAPTFMTVGWIASAPWAKANPEAVRRFQNVMRQSARWANAHHAQSGSILAGYAKIDPSVIGLMARVPYGESLRASLVQPNIDLAVKYKLIETSFSAQQLIY